MHNLSYVLRGCILIELSWRKRIALVKDAYRPSPFDGLVQVTSLEATGEPILDEALRHIATDSQTVAGWMDLLSGMSAAHHCGSNSLRMGTLGETWNVTKLHYQLKLVCERLAKGLVEKGVLRTDKMSFLNIFEMATHPVANPSVKAAVKKKCSDTLLGRGATPDSRAYALVCVAHIAEVLEDALDEQSESERGLCLQRADEIFRSICVEDKNSRYGNEITADVFYNLRNR